MQLTFLGTGAQQVPVFGCDCLICQRAARAGISAASVQRHA